MKNYFTRFKCLSFLPAVLAVVAPFIGSSAFAYGLETRETSCKLYATSENYYAKPSQLKHTLKLSIFQDNDGHQKVQVLRGKTDFAPSLLKTTQISAFVDERRELGRTGFALRASITVGMRDRFDANLDSNLQYLLALMSGEYEVSLKGAAISGGTATLMDGSLRSPQDVTEAVLMSAVFPKNIRNGQLYKIYVSDCKSVRMDRDGHATTTRIGH